MSQDDQRNATPSRRSHAGPRSRSSEPEVPQPSHAERTCTLLYQQQIGYLSTHSRKLPGFPFGSVMPYALGDDGRPIFLISKMAMHTQNLDQNGKSSLLVPDSAAARDALGAARATLMGETRAVTGEDLHEVRETYLQAHERARYYVDYADFGFYRMDVADVYFVGGFGVMGWVTSNDYQEASRDPLAEVAEGIIDHMNADHADALVLLASEFAGLDGSDATMTAIDRLGFHLRLQVDGRYQGQRIAFLRPVESAEETRQMMVDMVRQARGS